MQITSFQTRMAVKMKDESVVYWPLGLSVTAPLEPQDAS